MDKEACLLCVYLFIYLGEWDGNYLPSPLLYYFLQQSTTQQSVMNTNRVLTGHEGGEPVPASLLPYRLPVVIVVGVHHCRPRPARAATPILPPRLSVGGVGARAVQLTRRITHSSSPAGPPWVSVKKGKAVTKVRRFTSLGTWTKKKKKIKAVKFLLFER